MERGGIDSRQLHHADPGIGLLSKDQKSIHQPYDLVNDRPALNADDIRFQRGPEMRRAPEPIVFQPVAMLVLARCATFEDSMSAFFNALFYMGIRIF